MSGAFSDPKETGTALLKQGRFDEAAAVLKEAVALDPNDEVAWRLLGGAMASKGDPQGAITAFQNAVRLVPMAARSHYNLGLAYQSAEKYPESKAALEKAIALDPGHEQARARLAEVAQQLGARPVAASAGHTNIGGAGDVSGLASVGGMGMPVASAPVQSPPSEGGHTNIGGGNSIGLATIGAHREAPSGGGHTNIGGSNSIGLASVGSASVTPQDTGHTNIGGGNSGMLGGVGGAAGSPSLRPSPGMNAPMSAPQSYAPPMSAPPSMSPQSYVPTPVLGQNYSQDLMNTSGMNSDVPYDVAKPFNWAAFLFGWDNLGFLWSFNMRLRVIGAIQLVMAFLPFFIGVGIGVNAVGSGGRLDPSSLSGMNGLGAILGFARFGLALYLGFKGNGLAWQNRTFGSQDDFHQCQRIWAQWAVGLLACGLLVVILALVFAGAAVLALATGGRTH